MSKRVVIIGGGIIGLTAAYYCLRDGHEVVVVESGTPDHDCCARGNAGMIVPSHFIPLAAPGMVSYGLRMMSDPQSPFHIRPRLEWRLADWGMNFIAAATEERVAAAAPVLRDLSLASRKLFVELSREPEFRFALKQNGLLMLCREADALGHESEMAERARRMGIPAETLSATETAALEPTVDLDVAGSVYFPRDCHLDPAQLLSDLTAFLRANGATFRWQNPVVGWRTMNGRIQSASATNAEIEGDEFILAGGAASPALASRLGLHLPMQAGKGYSLTLPQPPQRPKTCCILTEARVAVTPIGRQLRFGGTMEIAGNDRSISPGRLQGIARSASAYFPRFAESDFSEVPPWVGLRPCSPDGLPYIGRTSRVANLIVATGHAMLGLSLAPVTGQLIAAQLAGVATGLDSPLLSPDRYLGY